MAGLCAMCAIVWCLGHESKIRFQFGSWENSVKPYTSNGQSANVFWWLILAWEVRGAAMVFCYQNYSDLLRKKCSWDRDKLLKFEAEGQKFVKCLRSLEQFIPTVQGQNNFWYVKECFFNLLLEFSYLIN